MDLVVGASSNGLIHVSPLEDDFSDIVGYGQRFGRFRFTMA